jgi:hypothetical protein
MGGRPGPAIAMVCPATATAGPRKDEPTDRWRQDAPPTPGASLMRLPGPPSDRHISGPYTMVKAGFRRRHFADCCRSPTVRPGRGGARLARGDPSRLGEIVAAEFAQRAPGLWMRRADSAPEATLCHHQIEERRFGGLDGRGTHGSLH